MSRSRCSDPDKGGQLCLLASPTIRLGISQYIHRTHCIWRLRFGASIVYRSSRRPVISSVSLKVQGIEAAVLQLAEVERIKPRGDNECHYRIGDKCHSIAMERSKSSRRMRIWCRSNSIAPVISISRSAVLMVCGVVARCAASAARVTPVPLSAGSST